MIKCNFCNNNFGNANSLSKHKKTARYCIEIQDKIRKKYLCIDCSTEVFEDDYNDHLKLCIDKRINEVILQKDAEKEELILSYETKIKNIIESYEDKLNKNHEELIDIIKNTKTTVINKNTQNTQNTQRINTVINNLIPITEQHFEEQTNFLTLDHIKDGVNGYVKCALEHHFKDRIICVDYARRKIKYKNSKGELVDDPEMVKLSENYFKSIEPRNTDIINGYIKALGDEIYLLNTTTSNKMDDSETEVFQRKSNEILDNVNKAFTQKAEVKDAAKGKKSNIYMDFVKDICAKTVN